VLGGQAAGEGEKKLNLFVVVVVVVVVVAAVVAA
jgi:hypothetical protein